jgi:hypothetical protein
MVATVHVLGLRIASRATRWVASVVILDASSGDVAECLEHVSNRSHNEATQARELRDALSSALSPYEDLVAGVLFEADYSARATLKQGTKDRLRLEGAALTACLDHVRQVEVMNAIGRAYGGSKEDVLAAAAALGVKKEYIDAAAGALAATSLA